ncbi:MAG: PIN-like domain-containing protein [Bacilli bacterium]
MIEELIVFDTNVYLDLYSYSKEAVNDIIDSLEKFSFLKMYITQQIYDEFMKNYIRVRNNNLDYYKSQKGEFINKTNRISPLISNLFSGKYDRYESEIRRLCNEIEKLYINNCNKITLEFDRLISEVSTSYDSDDTDLILQFVKKLYQKSNPEGFTTLDKIQLSIEAEQRAKLKFGPCYTDLKKNSLNAYADFFIWKEILKKSATSKNIILVQNEMKTDWWEKKDNKLVPASILIEECPQLQMFNFLNFTKKYLLLSNNTFAETSEISSIFSYVLSTNDKKIFLCDEINTLLEEGLINYIKDGFHSNIRIEDLSYEFSLFIINDRKFFNFNYIKYQIDIGIKFKAQIIEIKDGKETYPFITGESLCQITPIYSIDKYNINSPLIFKNLDNFIFSNIRKSKRIQVDLF